jgi:transcriptional regulator with XRE-family HTH domain
MILYRYRDCREGERMKTLADELKNRMGERTQVEFAEALGIAQSTLSELLSGKRVPGLNRTAAAVVAAFPELAPFFLPENIATAKDERCSDSHEAPATDEGQESAA